MNKLNWFVPLMLLAVLVTSCNEDVELNADYRSDTVIFGILDPVLDTQWVRINRTWLGDGNNLDAAAIRDSSEYGPDDFVGKVYQWKNGNISNTWDLESTTRTDKDESGIFFGPEYTAYYFVNGEEELDFESEYQVYLEFDGKEDVFATTNIIEDFPGAVTQPPAGIFYTFNFATVNQNTTLYPDFNAKWATGENAKRYEVSLEVYYNEIVYTDETQTTIESEELKSLDWFIGTEAAADTDGGDLMTREIDGEAFFRFLEARLAPSPLIRREIGVWDEVEQKVRVVDFVLTIGNEELDTYIEVNSPVTGIIQERPQYSNVVNGLGLFASRRQIRVDGLGLTNSTYTALFQGEYTAPLSFCSPNPFSEDYCGE